MRAYDYKPGLSPIRLIGAIYLPLGLVFLAIGLIVGHFAFADDPIEGRAFTAAFCVMGGLFAATGAGLLAHSARRTRGIRRVIDEGHTVEATVTAVYQKRNVHVNGRSPWVVECQAADATGERVEVWTSEPVWLLPEGGLIGQTVQVYTDRSGGKWYYVDLGPLLPQFTEHKQ